MKWYLCRHFQRTAGILVLAVLLAALPARLFAADSYDFPHKVLDLSIVFSPGGALDAAARVLAGEAEPLLGQAIVPRNEAGGGGMPGVAKLAAARPDGYSLAAAVSNALIYIPHRNKAPYKPLADVEPVLAFGQAAPLLVVAPGSPYADIDAFFAASREHKGELRIGVPGLGTPSHIALAMMSKHDPSLTWRFVPFGGPGEAETALLGGHVDAAASGALPRIKNGQLRPLMVLAGSRLPALPDVPALADRGFADPGRGDSLFVLLAPRGTPETTLDKLEAAFTQAAQSEAFLRALEGWSVAPALKSRAETKAFLAEAWRAESAILAELGLTAQPATRPE